MFRGQKRKKRQEANSGKRVKADGVEPARRRKGGRRAGGEERKEGGIWSTATRDGGRKAYVFLNYRRAFRGKHWVGGVVLFVLQISFPPVSIGGGGLSKWLPCYCWRLRHWNRAR